MKPPWIQPLQGNQVCSVCSSKQVFYSSIECYDIGYESCAGTWNQWVKYGAKCYCKECYQEYGGEIDAKRNSSDPQASEPGA